MITTASAATTTTCASFGADQVIDYNTGFHQVVSGCDAVFDTVGGEVTQRSFAVLKPGGRPPSSPPARRRRSRARRRAVAAPNVARDRPHLERIVELSERRGVPARDYALPAGRGRRGARGQPRAPPRGKLVLVMR